MSEKTNKGFIMALAVIMIICGFVAIGSPFMMGAIMTSVIGFMLIFGGISESIVAFSEGVKENLPILVIGLLTMITGVIVLKNPIFASGVFTLIMVGYFVVVGVLRSILAIKLKPVQGWGLTLFSGVLSVLLGIMLMKGWPVSGMMAIGIFAGIRLLFGGFGLLTLNAAVNSLK